MYASVCTWDVRAQPALSLQLPLPLLKGPAKHSGDSQHRTEMKHALNTTVGPSPRMPAQGPALVQLWVKSRWNLWFEPVHLRSFSYSLPKVSWKLTLETYLRPKPERWCAAFWKFPNLWQLLERPCNLLYSFFSLFTAPQCTAGETISGGRNAEKDFRKPLQDMMEWSRRCARTIQDMERVSEMFVGW